MQRNLLLASSSVCHPWEYLDHCQNEMESLFAEVPSIVFVPYARPGGISHSDYTAKVRERFAKLGKDVAGVHEFDSPTRAIERAAAVFIGGGNTFVLLRELYSHSLVVPLRERILNGMPYMGTSAGTNVAGLSIGTSNDMPIVFPPSLMSLEVVPFNINPHYPAGAPDPQHKGETREERIAEFHHFNSQPVVGIREDSMLRVRGNQMTLVGQRPALIFEPGSTPQELPADSDLSFLL